MPPDAKTSRPNARPDHVADEGSPRPARKLPFEIMQGLPGSLADQITAGLRRAIAANYYAPGDPLPTIRGMARELGISIRGPLEAVRRLAEEGLLTRRARCGCLVAPRDARSWVGHVVFIGSGDDEGFYYNALATALRHALVDIGYLFTRESIMRTEDGGLDLSRLRLALDAPVTLAVNIHDDRDVIDLLDRSGVPYVTFSPIEPRGRGCVGFVRFDRNAAVPAFIAHCRAARIRSVLVVQTEEGEITAEEPLRAAGIRVERLILDYHDVRSGLIESCQRHAMEAFEKLLCEGGKAALPDLLLIADDFQAAGVLVALQHHGVRIPEDVKLVVWANRGLGPVYWKSLTRMEVDPVLHGRILAEHVIARLRGKSIPDDARIGPVYIPGETFPTPEA